MEQFAYSFAITMMHSIWQMALLLLFYYAATQLFRKWPPIAKRNFLLLLLLAQIISSVISFYFIYSKPFDDYRENVQALLQSISTSQYWLQQYATVLFALYSVGLLYKLSYAWFNWKKFNALYKNALIKPSVNIRLFTEAKAIHFGIKRKVSVWCSQHIKTPVTFGFFKPVILLPVALVNQLNLQQTESLIVHELTHIKNNDYLFNWVMLVGDAIFFFNPFVKIVIQKIKVEREKSCDVQVLQFNYPAIGYAEALLYIARQQHMQPAAAPVAAVNKKTDLLNRIQFFSNEKNVNNQQAKYFSLATLLIWSFILLNVFFAAVFVTKPQAAQEITGFFVSSPLNEWNKSFVTAPVETATITATDMPEEQTISSSPPTNKKPVVAKKAFAPVVITDSLVNNQVAAAAEAPVKFSFVANTEIAANIKDVIIDEEVSGGKITQAFRVTTSANGEVIFEPLWMISEVKQLSDSMKQVIKKDSSIIKVIPAVQ